jgi:NAD(P)H-nitrite reductase large subunit
MDDEIICRCEEITRAELRAAIQDGASTMNELKRLTRAGMGLCQGRTCRRLVERFLAEEAGLPLGTVVPSTYRQPVRPVKAELFTCNPESQVRTD